MQSVTTPFHPEEGADYIERVEHWRATLPKGPVDIDLDDAYDQLLSDGCFPRLAAAAVRYVYGLIYEPAYREQGAIAELYDITPQALRTRADQVWEYTHGDSPRPSLPPGRRDSSADETDSEDADADDDEPESPSLPAGKRRARTVFLALYSADEPKLTTHELCDRVEFDDLTSTYDGLSRALRRLEDIEAVCGQRRTGEGTEKEWWAVPRNDTPDYITETKPYPDHTKGDLLEYVIDACDLEEKPRWGSGDGGYSHHRTGLALTRTGFEQVTGEASQYDQLQVLVDDYGLDPGECLSINVSLTRTGAARLAEQLAPESLPDSPDED